MTNPFLFDKNPQNKLKVYLEDIKLSADIILNTSRHFKYLLC